jgi:hypothetical protein
MVIWVRGVDDGIRDLKRLYILGWTDPPNSSRLLFPEARKSH